MRTSLPLLFTLFATPLAFALEVDVHAARVALNTQTETLEMVSPTFATLGIGEILAASRAEKISDTVALEFVRYSPCQTCEGEKKPWRLRAKSVELNLAEETLAYRHAWLDVLDVPVLYLPYLEHAVGDKPHNGFMMPLYGQHENLGSEFGAAYYHHFPEHHADTLNTVRHFTKRGTQWMNTSRWRGKNGWLDIDGSVLDDSATDSVRNHAAISGQLLGGARGNSAVRMGLNMEKTSDREYLADYFSRSDSYLTSTAFVEWAGRTNAAENWYLGAYGAHFQELNTFALNRPTDHVLPRVQAERWFTLNQNGGSARLWGDMLNLREGVGDRTRRLSAGFDLIQPWWVGGETFLRGSRVEAQLNIRNDAYYVAQNGVALNASRFLPTASVQWEQPLLNTAGTHRLTPQLMVAYAPRANNLGNIPNNDSVAYELDVTNLFSTNRFAGFDRTENGLRVIYGLESAWGDAQTLADKPKLAIFLGQQFRTEDNALLPQDGGTETVFSDYVGTIRGYPRDDLQLASQFRVDSATGRLQRLDLSGSWQPREGTKLGGVYTFLNGGVNDMSLYGETQLADKWRLSSRVQYDFDSRDLLLGESTLTYQQDCYEVALTARRRGYVNNTLQPSNDVLLNVKLKTLGQYE